MIWTIIIAVVAGFVLGAVMVTAATVTWNKRAKKQSRLSQQRAQSTQRLAELGTMTGGLAHEIKNPLSTIGLNAQLLGEDLSDIAKEIDSASAKEQISRVQHRLDSLLRETNRLREILDDFLHFAGRMKLDLRPTDINTLIDELVDFYQPQASQDHINIRTLQADKKIIVNADTKLLKQAILNLLINATQAMTDARQNSATHGGANELMIRTKTDKISGHNQAHIHIIDTGPGIDKDMAEKIFHPYVSMRRGGTGLGLPTTRRIIEEHGGHIDVQGEPGRGSDFIITLPAGRNV